MTKIGVIFHWGLYSVPAYDDMVSVRRRKMQNGSEWYKKRLEEKSDYRPISGHINTKKFHSDNYGEQKYDDFEKVFDTKDWNPDEWMKLAKKINAEYVILTSKHHDGYCLWDTKTTEHNSVQTCPKEDLLLKFKESAHKFGLKFGIYYSWSEFDRNFTKDYIKTVVEPQMNELKGYNPDIWWFDGHWSIKTKFAINKINEIVKSLKEKDVEINDRIPDITLSTFKNFEDRYIPKENPNEKWEYIGTIGYSWGINKYQDESDYKTSKQLQEIYEKVSKFDGNFLINLGPSSDGKLDEHEVNCLLNFIVV